ncbi:hypothetical protein AOQ84DRAFT_162745 [Glonium stellatum]|uniref:Uncharacterized protein n=1 Tax=Glonium stellatum TaxID=574774 RepID=A0A8E2EQZ4_9PEZI|nr:hypothetical protein AOQ84DRAFT_162745 [Glonium stellatum]
MPNSLSLCLCGGQAGVPWCFHAGLGAAERLAIFVPYIHRPIAVSCLAPCCCRCSGCDVGTLRLGAVCQGDVTRRGHGWFHARWALSTQTMCQWQRCHSLPATRPLSPRADTSMESGTPYCDRSEHSGPRSSLLTSSAPYRPITARGALQPTHRAAVFSLSALPALQVLSFQCHLHSSRLCDLRCSCFPVLKLSPLPTPLILVSLCKLLPSSFQFTSRFRFPRIRPHLIAYLIDQIPPSHPAELRRTKKAQAATVIGSKSTRRQGREITAWAAAHARPHWHHPRCEIISLPPSHPATSLLGSPFISRPNAIVERFASLPRAGPQSDS